VLAHAVRGMKAAMCSLKSSSASGDGASERIDSVWHFRIILAMYVATCSVMVNTEPWPIGAFGPRNTD
jgi:hypothetical protein